MNAIRIILVVVLGTSSVVWGQNQLHVSQFNLYQPFINPAASADISTLNAGLLHKSQWISVKGAPTFQQFGFSMPLGDGDKNFVGASVRHDRIGVNSALNISGNYAYKLKLNLTSSLAFGLTGGVDVIQSKLDEVPLNDESDPVFNSNTGTFAAPNFQFGMFYRNQKFYAGFATPNILKNRVVFEDVFTSETSFDMSDVHFYLSSGYKFELNETTDFRVDGLFKHSVGAPMQIDLNLSVMFNDKFAIGAAYRTPNIVAAMVNFVVLDGLTIGYAYDYNFSALRYFSGGSHEIALIYKLKEHVSINSFDKEGPQ